MKLPFDNKAEQSLLGSVLLSPDTLDRVSVRPDQFFHERHSALWKCLLDMHSSGKIMDAITIGDYIKTTGKLEAVGGYEYLGTLMDEVEVSGHSQHYASIVKEKFDRRAAIISMTNAIEKLEKSEHSASEIKGDIVSELLTAEDATEDSRDMGELCEEYLEKCKAGEVGHFDWWCPEWTQHIGRLDSELVILHAPRSTGKTALMLQWIVEAHTGGFRTPLASIEMLKKDLTGRLISNVGKVSTYTMQVRRSVTPYEEQKASQAIKTIRAMKLCVRDKAMSIDDIRSWALKEARTKADCIFIDNLLSINDGGRSYQSKTIMYDDFIRKFRDLRDVIGKPIILLAHPNAEGSIAWSKDVENFADIILFLYNVPPEGVKINGKLIMQREFSGKHVVAQFQKNRNGITPVAHLDFDGSHQTFIHIDWEN